jgi:hypothetical protein
MESHLVPIPGKTDFDYCPLPPRPTPPPEKQPLTPPQGTARLDSSITDSDRFPVWKAIFRPIN